MNTKDVSTPCAEYLEMAEARELPNILTEGTAGMRKAGKRYLPQEPAESTAAIEMTKTAAIVLRISQRAGNNWNAESHPRIPVCTRIPL